MFVVPILAQERYVYGTIYQLHWSYTESFTLSYVTSFVWHIVVSIIEVMRINWAYYKSFLSLLSTIYDLTNINIWVSLSKPCDNW